MGKSVHITNAMLAIKLPLTILAIASIIMRYRERDDRTKSYPWQNRRHEFTCADNTTNEDLISAFPDFWVGDFESITDVVTKGFSSRSARGEVIINPMKKVSLSRSLMGSSGSYTVPKYGSYTCNFSQERTNGAHTVILLKGQVGHNGVSIDVPNLQTLAGTAAKANVANPTFQGMVFIGELRETIGFLRNPISGFNKFLRKAKRDAQRNRKVAARFATLFDYLSDQWLSYRYAVRPLVQDVNNVYKALSEIIPPKPQRLTARGSAFDQGVASSTVQIYSAPWTVSRDSSTLRSVSVRAGMLYEYQVSLGSNLGLDASQIPVAIWELIPFSFVADWFLNIGNVVQAITPTIGVKVLGSWTTTVEEWQTSASGQIDKLDYASSPATAKRTLTSNGAISEQFRSSTKIRTPGISVGLAYSPVPYSGDLGKKRIVDSIALLNQLLHSKV